MFVALVIGVFTCAVTILQVLKDYKIVFVSLITGVILKAMFTTPQLRTIILKQMKVKQSTLTCIPL